MQPLSERIKDFTTDQFVDWLCLACVDVREVRTPGAAQEEIDKIRAAVEERLSALEQRAEAAEAKLETENKWRDLALQFDGHRMQAISLLKMIVNDAPEKQFTSVRNFLKCGPLSGEEVMNERLLVIANSRPAPAVSLAELVPEQALNGQANFLGDKEPYYNRGFNDCRAAILRNIEEENNVAK